MAYSESLMRELFGCFPLLGFPNESNVRRGVIVYECYFGYEARIAVWELTRPRAKRLTKSYALNLYHRQRTDKMETHQDDRYSTTQVPIQVADAFEAQLAINYLIQKHLPLEVIDDIYGTDQSDKRTQAAEMRTDAAAGETVE